MFTRLLVPDEECDAVDQNLKLFRKGWNEIYRHHVAAEAVLEFYTFPLLPATSSSAGTPSYIVFFSAQIYLDSLNWPKKSY